MSAILPKSKTENQSASMLGLLCPTPDQVDGNTIKVPPTEPLKAPAHEIVGSAFATNPQLRPSGTRPPGEPSGTRPPVERVARFRFGPITGHTLEIPGAPDDARTIEIGDAEIGVGAIGVLAFMVGLRFHLDEAATPWIGIPYAWSLDDSYSLPIAIPDQRFAPQSLRSLRLVLVDRLTGNEITARSLMLPEQVAFGINRFVARADVDYRRVGDVQLALDVLVRGGWSGIDNRNKVIGRCT